MITAILAIIAGLALLVWSADRFVEGSACTAFQGAWGRALGGSVASRGTEALPSLREMIKF